MFFIEIITFSLRESNYHQSSRTFTMVPDLLQARHMYDRIGSKPPPVGNSNSKEKSSTHHFMRNGP